MSSNVTRRSFFKGAGLAALGRLSAAALSGCGHGYAARRADQSERPATSAAPSWLGAPPVIDEADITETIDTEVLVVGMGTSGIPAMISAAENGAKVLGTTARAPPITSARTSAPSIRACNRPPSTSSRSSASRRKRPSRTSSATPTAL